MKIEVLGHADRYSIQQVADLFLTPEADLVISSVYDGKGNLCTRASFDGRSVEEVYPATQGDDKAWKHTVKQATYRVMKRLIEKETPWGILTGIRPTKFCRMMHETLSYPQIRQRLIEDFWVSPEKADVCLTVTKKAQPLIDSMKKTDIGLYIGIPFCPSRCAYCSFISESAVRHKKILPAYTNAMVKELYALGALARRHGLTLRSLYVGGGTPTTLGSSDLCRVLEAAFHAFSMSPHPEITVEAGRPDALDKAMLSALKAEGVGRICINPQTMNDTTLRRIGRFATARQVEEAFAEARALGFQNINADIIAGLPGEGLEQFETTLSAIGALAPEGLTVHTMYLKRASRLSKENAWEESGEVGAMIRAAQMFAEKQAYDPYYMYKQRNTAGNQENTGYAKEGYASLYNVAIMEETHTIFACGAGASSKLVHGNAVERVYNTKDVAFYTNNIDDVIAEKIVKMDNILGTI